MGTTKPSKVSGSVVLGFSRKWAWLVATATMLALPALLSAARGPITLEEQVRHELVTLPYYGVFDDLSFQVSGNTVTLLGKVWRPVLKSDAENVVKRIPGVTSVDNQIEVLPLSPFDNRIRLAEVRAIYGNTVLNRYALVPLAPIRIIVSDGHVTLEGAVASQMDKDTAGLAASGVSGVFSVTNNLVVGA